MTVSRAAFFGCDAVECCVSASLHHYLDGILDALAGVAQSLGKVFERESVRMHLGCVETLLRHERFRTMRGALAFAADAKDVDDVADEMGDIDFGRLAGESREADTATAVDHTRRFVDRVWSTRALDHVIDTLAAVEFARLGNNVFLVVHIDDVIRTQLLADLKAIVARAGENDRLCAERLGNRDAQQADRARTRDDNALASNEAAKFGQAIHRGACRYDQRRLYIRHRVGDTHERIDVVDGVFGEATIGGETIGAMPLVEVAVVQAVVVARGVL